MLFFPQLSSYPAVKRSIQRTVVNALADGTADVFPDADAASVAWELRFKGLTQAEWSSIQSLFSAVSGCWQTFTFLDPVGNLLAQSENFAASPWVNGALIQLTSGIDDPFGTTRAIRAINAGGAAESISQTLDVPPTYRYCLSVWARSSGGSNVTLAIGSSTRTFATTSQWTRVFLVGSGGTFAAELDPGVEADLFGMQVEAQPAASDYKKTGARGGVYARARFADDKLTVTAQGSDLYDVAVRIVSTEN